MFFVCISDSESASCSRAQNKKGSSFIVIGNNSMLRSMQTYHPFNDERVRTESFYFYPQSHQKLTQIFHVRFSSSNFNNCFANTTSRQHHHIFRTSHRTFF